MTDNFIVFHTSEAGRPQVYLDTFGKHGWTYEPKDWISNEPFAPVYDTASEALNKALDWNVQQEAESEVI